MKYLIRVSIVFFLLFLVLETADSQPLTGTKTIPGDYATIKAAITALNSLGVGSGGVTFNVSAGYTETLASDSLYLFATGTSANPIVFQKSGTGSNPCVTRTDAGTKATSSIGGNGDAIVIIEGSDYVTFNGIDVTASDAGIEYGYYIRKASATDGCKYVTVKNCVITMNKGTSAYVVGLYASNNIITSLLSSSAGVAVTSESGRHENITITGNTTQNTFAGMYFIGYNHTTSPYNFYDQNFVIGAEGAGNIIKNFGGNAASTVNGINIQYHNNESISYNTINNTDGGNTGFTTFGNGMLLNTAKAVTFNVSYNTITVSNTSAATSKYLYGIQINAGDAASTITINNNTFQNCVCNGTGVLAAIYQGTVANTNIFANTITNMTSVSTVYPIYNSAGTGTNLIYNNSVSNISTSGATSTIYGIYAAKGTNYIYNNLIYGLTASASSSTADAIRGISISSTTATTTIGLYYNTIYLNASSSGTNFGTSCVYHTYNATSTTAALDMRNNILVNTSTANGTGLNAVLKRSAATDLNNFSTTSNNNCFYAGTPSSTNLIYYDGTNSLQTIADYKTLVTPRDSASFSENPPFVNVLIQPYDFHLNGNPCQCENGGLPITSPISVTTDLENKTRNVLTPDLGAYETAIIASKVILLSPINNSIDMPVNIATTWQKANGKIVQRNIKSIDKYWFEYSTDAGFSSSIIDSSLTDTTKYLTGLSYNTKYYWKVKAKNQTGWGTFSDVWNFTTTVPVPVSPALISPANNSVDLSITPALDWNNVSYAASYRVQISTSASFSSITFDSAGLTISQISVPNGILGMNTKYYWRVSASNASGTSEYSTIWNFTTSPNIPNVPLLSSPANNSSGQPTTIIFQWYKPVETAFLKKELKNSNVKSYAISKYWVEYSTDSTFGTIIGADTTLTDTTKTITGLSNITKYFWRVRAKNQTGWGAFSAVWNFTTVVPIPVSPTLISPANNSVDLSITPSLDWNDVAYATSYRVQISTSSSFSSLNYDTAGLTVSQIIVPNGILTTNTQYYWRVCASNVSGTSVYSTIWNFTTRPNTPNVPLLAFPANNSTGQPINISFKWYKAIETLSDKKLSANMKVNGNIQKGETPDVISKYRFDYSTDSTFTTILGTDTTLTDTTKTITGLSNNTKYYWRVEAKNQTGWGGFSVIWNFITLLPIPLSPTLLTPINNSTNISLSPVLSWNNSAYASNYRIQVSSDSLFLTTAFDTAGVIGTSVTLPLSRLTGLTKYYWRVNASNNTGTGEWSSVWNFTTVQNLSLNLKVYLEGFWDGTSHVSDTTMIYLASSSSPYDFIDSAKGVLTSTGTTIVNFTKAPNGSYYIAVKHRNHLETWSKFSQSFVTNSTVNYDFTTAASQAYGDNMKQSGSVWVLYAGDVNQDGSVDAFDVVIFAGQFGNTGYLCSDLNGDLSVDAMDVIIFVADFGLTKSTPFIIDKSTGGKTKEQIIKEIKTEFNIELNKQNKKTNKN
jgi:hypothetical protein